MQAVEGCMTCCLVEPLLNLSWGPSAPTSLRFASMTIVTLAGHQAAAPPHYTGLSRSEWQ